MESKSVLWKLSANSEPIAQVPLNSTNRTSSEIARPGTSPELREGGFREIRVLAVEGPVWSASQFREAWGDPVHQEKLMEFLSLIESEPSVQGASAHIIAVGRPGS